tara:strand:+ start:1497 stop:1748 length:252 start_codon:yes stop_codon:yes gene_type:complete
MKFCSQGANNYLTSLAITLKDGYCFWQYLGAVAEWLRSGLQIRLYRFDSGPRLHFPTLTCLIKKCTDQNLTDAHKIHISALAL